jgi:hypothetical protein
MKAASLFVAGLAVAFLLIASANAEKNENSRRGCSTTTWPAVSAVPCLRTNVHDASYVECTTRVMQMGWRPSDAWWGCSNLGFKN